MSTRLFVGNVSYNLDEEGLTQGFAEQGFAVENVRIARDKDTKRPRGFAFIEVDDKVADELLSKGAHVGGRDLRIERSAKQPGDDPRDGRRGGGGGGGGGGGRRGGGGGDGGGRRDRRGDSDWGGGDRDRRQRW